MSLKLICYANGGIWASESDPFTRTTQPSSWTALPVVGMVSRSGYTLTGWKQTTGTTYSPGANPWTSSEIASTADITKTFYAVWEATSSGGGTTTPTPSTAFTVSFNGNGGTGVPASISMSAPGNITIPSQTPYKSGYKFAYWQIQGSATTATPGKVIYVFNDTTFVACYTQDTTVTPVEPEKYLIQFMRDANTVAATNYYPAGYITIECKLTTTDGRTLLGWSTIPGGAVAYSPTGRYYVSGPAKLYAVFSDPPKPKYTISFDGNGGTCSAAAKTIEEGSCIPSLPTASRTGYTLSGWYDNPTGGNKYTTSTPVYRNVTLYAHWTASSISDPTISCYPTLADRDTTLTVKWSGPYVSSGITLTYNLQIRGAINSAGTMSDWTIIYPSTTLKEYTYNTSGKWYATEFRVQATASTGAKSNFVSCKSELNKGSAPERSTRCTVRSNENDSTTIFTNSNKTTYDVAWDAVSDPKGFLQGYELEMCTSNNQTWRSTTRASKTANHITPYCSALTGATWVKWRVRAYDEFGRYSDWRESSQVTVSALSAPAWTDGKGWIRYPVPSASFVREQVAFNIEWCNAKDVDGDLTHYVLAREDNEDGNWTRNTFTLKVGNVQNGQPAWTDVIKSTTVNKIRYRVYAEDSTQRRTAVVTGPVITVQHNTPPKAPTWIRALVEETARAEGHPYQMQPLKGGENNQVLWAPAVDAENNVVGYQLECSLDGEAWRVIKGYNDGTARLDLWYDYFIPKSRTVRHDTAQFRVKAIDAFGEESPYATSREYNISNNSTPVVVGEHANEEYIGVFETGFPIIFRVTDEENDSVEIEVSVYDGNAKVKEITKFNANTPYDGTVILTDKIFQELPMHRLTVKVTAKDREGMGVYWFDFTRKGTWATVTLNTPIKYPDPITACKFVTLDGLFPSDCKMIVEATNNANDPMGGFWEDVTSYARANLLYTFQNKIAVYGPAFNFRIRVERGSSGQSGYISKINGYFETATEKGATF